MRGPCRGSPDALTALAHMSGQATLPDALPPVKRAAEKRRAKAAHPGEKSRAKRKQKVAAGT
jgi:hypothetical protein